MSEAQGVADLVHRHRQSQGSGNRRSVTVSSGQRDPRQVNRTIPGPLQIGNPDPFSLELFLGSHQDLGSGSIPAQHEADSEPGFLPCRERATNRADEG